MSFGMLGHMHTYVCVSLYVCHCILIILFIIPQIGANNGESKTCLYTAPIHHDYCKAMFCSWLSASSASLCWSVLTRNPLWLNVSSCGNCRNCGSQKLSIFDMDQGKSLRLTFPRTYWSPRSILPNRDDFWIAIRSTTLSNKIATESITGSESKKARRAAPL